MTCASARAVICATIPSCGCATSFRRRDARARGRDRRAGRNPARSLKATITLDPRPADRISGHPPLDFDLSTFDTYATFRGGGSFTPYHPVRCSRTSLRTSSPQAG